MANTLDTFAAYIPKGTEIVEAYQYGGDLNRLKAFLCLTEKPFSIHIDSDGEIYFMIGSRCYYIERGDYLLIDVHKHVTCEYHEDFDLRYECLDTMGGINGRR